MSTQLYRLLPMIARQLDSDAVAGLTAGNLQNVVGALEEAYDNAKADAEGLPKLIDVDETDAKYLGLLSEGMGQMIGNEFNDKLRRHMIHELVPFFKTKGMHKSVKSQIWRLLGKKYRAWELYKHTIYEVGDYSRYEDYDHRIKAARYDIYDAFDGKFFEVIDAIPLDRFFRDVMPIHVILRYHVRRIELSDHMPTTVDSLDGSAVEAYVNETVRRPTEEITFKPTCVAGCMSSCMEACMAGHCQTGCLVSCQGGCTTGCMTGCRPSTTTSEPGRWVKEEATAPGNEAWFGMLGGVAGFSGAIETFLACLEGYDAAPPHYAIPSLVSVKGVDGTDLRLLKFDKVQICYPIEDWIGTGAALNTASCAGQKQTGFPSWLVDQEVLAWTTLPTLADPTEFPLSGAASKSIAGDAIASARKNTAEDPTYRLRVFPQYAIGDIVTVRYWNGNDPDNVYVSPIGIGNGTNRDFAIDVNGWAPIALMSARIEVLEGDVIVAVAIADLLGRWKGSVDPTADLGVYKFDFDVGTGRILFDVAPTAGATVQISVQTADPKFCFWMMVDTPGAMWSRLA